MDGEPVEGVGTVPLVNFATRCRHLIEVSLAPERLPAHVTEFYFTLSAFFSADLSCFKRPWVRFFNADVPSHQLTRYEIPRTDTQAVVVCSLTRVGGRWDVLTFGAPCKGSARNYAPIVRAVKEDCGQDNLSRARRAQRARGWLVVWWCCDSSGSLSLNSVSWAL